MTVKTITTSHFSVEFSVPPTGNQRYRQNITVEVISSSMERALEIVREEFSDSVFHNVRRLGTEKKIIIDMEMIV